MKKALPIVLVAVVAAALVFALRPGKGGHVPDLAMLAPAGSMLFLAVPDAHASGERWGQTALAKIAAEPEVREFLEKPKTRFEGMPGGLLQEWKALGVSRAFLALVSVEENEPRLVGGFQFDGTAEALETAIGSAKARLLAAYPAARTDLETHEGIAVEILDAGELKFVHAKVDDWLFAANNPELLKETLDRFAGRSSGESLQGDADYQVLRAKLPAAPEFFAVVQMEELITRLEPLLLLSGADAAEQIAALKQIRGFAAATAFEGLDLRDTLFVLGEVGGEKTPMEMPSLRFAGENTVATFFTRLNLPGTLDLPETGTDWTAALAGFLSGLAFLEEEGINLETLADAFGPEAGFQLDWSPTAPQPQLLGALDVRDREVVSKLLATLAARYGSAWNLSRVEEDGAEIYHFATAGIVPVTPTIALVSDRLYFSSDRQQIQAVLAGNAPAGLAQSPEFTKASGRVPEATESFAFIDGRALFERLYGTLRPMVVFGAGFVPGLSETIDPSKLPTTEVVSQHLGPIVFSQRNDAEGMLISSVGPVTLNHFIMVGVFSGAMNAWKQARQQ